MSFPSWFHEVTQDHLIQWPDLGVAYLPIKAEPLALYDDKYYKEYCRRANTEIGVKLTEARVEWAKKHGILPGYTIDVGVGSGQFMLAYRCFGYDINPEAIKMINAHRSFWNPLDWPYSKLSLTFWDSLEHIPNPKPLLDRVTDYVMISTPIYRDLAKVKNSKHYKPNEHCWYFTHNGVIAFMAYHRFQMMGYSPVETQLGREDIMTYAFRRIK